MIRYIDFEHRNLSANDPGMALRLAGRRERARYRFEKMAQGTCLVVCYEQFNESLLTELSPEAMVCSRNTVHREYDTDDLMGVEWLLKALPVPLFTICGSYHWMLKLRGFEIGLSGVHPLFERIPPEEFPEEHAYECLLVKTFDQWLYD